MKKMLSICISLVFLQGCWLAAEREIRLSRRKQYRIRRRCPAPGSKAKKIRRR